MPPDNAAFTGRDLELRRVLAAAAADAAAGILTIDGMAGIGKTAFAVYAARQIAAGFPDGQFFVRLHGHTPGQQPTEPDAALVALLGNLGLSAEQLPPGTEERAALWRDRAAGKRILLVLDDAKGSEQVRPLLPGAPGTLVLVTSRRRLTALPEAQATTLDVLSPTGRPGSWCGWPGATDSARPPPGSPGIGAEPERRPRGRHDEPGAGVRPVPGTRQPAWPGRRAQVPRRRGKPAPGGGAKLNGR